MARQGLRRVAILVVLAIATEILIGTVVDGHPGQKPQSNQKHQTAVAPKKPQRIAGSVATTITEYPHMVAIYYNGLFLCGGTLVGARLEHVLTAANCMMISKGKPRERNLFHVAISTVNIFSFDATTIIRNLKKITMHPEFNKLGQLENDIALLTLDKPVRAKIVPAKLETAADYAAKEYSEKDSLALGWGSTFTWTFGTTGAKITYSPVLKFVDLSTLSNKACVDLNKQVLPGAKFDLTHGGKALCAKALREKEGICAGDLGGPLHLEGVQIGIASRYFGCGDEKYPMIFTRVGAYRNWINQEMNNKGRRRDIK